jgi:hypothetical protein
MAFFQGLFLAICASAADEGGGAAQWERLDDRFHVKLVVPDRATAASLVEKVKRVKIDEPHRAPQSLRNLDILEAIPDAPLMKTTPRWKVLEVGGKPWDPAWDEHTSDAEILGSSNATTLLVEPTLRNKPSIRNSNFLKHPIVSSYLETATPDWYDDEIHQGYNHQTRHFDASSYDAYYPPGVCLDSSPGCFCGWAQCPQLCNPRCNPADGTPVPTPRSLPPPVDFTPMYGDLYTAITGVKIQHDELHAEAKAEVTPEIDGPAVADESIQGELTRLLEPYGEPIPQSLTDCFAANGGAEPGPFSLPPCLSQFLAESEGDLGVMEDASQSTLIDDVNVAKGYVGEYEGLMKDVSRVGQVSQLASENSAAGAADEALSIRQSDHADMVSEEADLTTMMSGVSGDLMLKKDMAREKQDQLFARVRGTIISRAEQEKVAAEAVKEQADQADPIVTETEQLLVSYQQNVNDLLDRVKARIATIDVTPMTAQALSDSERRIGEKDGEVEEAAAKAETDLTTMITDSLQTWAQKQYDEITTKANELTFTYPTEWKDIIVRPASDKATAADQLNQASVAKLDQAVKNAKQEARLIAMNTHHEALWVARQFESPDGPQFRAADIDPVKFNADFAGLNDTSNYKGEPMTGWTVKDVPTQKEKIDQVAAGLEILADTSLADMYQHASERLGAVKHEVGNASAMVLADVAEAEGNKTATVEKSDESAEAATQLAKDVEAADQLAKAGNVEVSVASSTAKNQMTTKLNEAKDSIDKSLQSFNDDSATALDQAKLDVQNAIASIKNPLDTLLLPTVAEITSTLKTKSGSWTQDLNWLETALGKLEDTVEKYAGGHKELNALEKQGNSEITAARYNLARNKEERNKTRETLEEKTDLATGATTMFVKSGLGQITTDIRQKLRARNKDLYDRMSVVGKALQGVDGNFKSNSQELKEGMKMTRQKVQTLQDQLSSANQQLTLDKSELKNSVGVIKASIKELINAHKKTMKDAQSSISGSLDASTQHDALVYKDSEEYMKEQLKSGTASTDKALNSAEGEIDELFEQRTQAMSDETNEITHSAEDMTFNAKTVGQLLEEAYEEISDRAETLISGAGSTVELEESTIQKIKQYAEFMESQLTTSAANALNFNERALNRERTVLENDQLEAAQELAKYLQASGMSEQHALDAAADIVRAAAATVNEDEESAAKKLGEITSEFEQTEDGLGTSNSTDASGAFSDDSGAAGAAFHSATVKDEQILASTQAGLGSMESGADEAGEALLSHVEAETSALEAENVRNFDTVEEAIQAAENVTAEGRLSLKQAGANLRQQSKDLWAGLNTYKSNVTEKIEELDALNAQENSTLFRNVRILKAFMGHSLAMERQMMAMERQHIADQRVSADKMFDETELKVAAFAQEVGHLMDSGAFQKLKKIQQADEDVALVTKENDAFVLWLNETEQTSIPWMQNVLHALGEAHQEKIDEEKKKEVEEWKLAQKEARQTSGSFSKVENLVQGSTSAMSTAQFHDMRLSSTQLLNQMGSSSGMQDAARQRELEAEMERSQSEGSRELASADSGVQSTREQVIGANQGVTEVGGRLERTLRDTYRQTDLRAKQTEKELDGIVDKAMLPDSGGSSGSWTDGYFQPSSLMEESSLMEVGLNASIASSFAEEGSGDRVTAADAREWMGLVAKMHRLGQNYTALTEENNELGVEVAHLREQAVDGVRS